MIDHPNYISISLSLPLLPACCYWICTCTNLVSPCSVAETELASQVSDTWPPTFFPDMSGRAQSTNSFLPRASFPCSAVLAFFASYMLITRGQTMTNSVDVLIYIKSSLFTSLVEYSTKQYPRGSPFSAPVVWRRYLNEIILPKGATNFSMFCLNRRRERTN